MEFTHVWDHIKARPWRSLLDLELHCNMFPLTLILQLQLTEKEKLFFREKISRCAGFAVERVTRLELATFCLGSKHSTN